MRRCDACEVRSALTSAACCSSVASRASAEASAVDVSAWSFSRHWLRSRCTASSASVSRSRCSPSHPRHVA